jgi:hypothetical protein
MVLHKNVQVLQGADFRINGVMDQLLPQRLDFRPELV